MAFAENLRRVRIERFMSQTELAKRAGLAKLTLSRLEAGITRPYARTVRQLAEVLGVEPAVLADPLETAEHQKKAAA